MRKFWVPKIIDGFWSGPKWTRTHRVKEGFRPVHGIFTMTKVTRSRHYRR